MRGRKSLFESRPFKHRAPLISDLNVDGCFREAALVAGFGRTNGIIGDSIKSGAPGGGRKIPRVDRWTGTKVFGVHNQEMKSETHFRHAVFSRLSFSLPFVTSGFVIKDRYWVSGDSNSPPKPI